MMFVTAVLLGGVLSMSSALAGGFWTTGKVTRTLTDQYYGGCMIALDVPINNGWPNSGWVSLDCQGKYMSKENAERAYGTAVSAIAMNKKVSVYVHNHQKHNNFCVARRVDMVAN